MAQIPNEEEILAAQLETDALIEEKILDQKSQEKEFILPEGGGPGVIPEEVWKEHKNE